MIPRNQRQQARVELHHRVRFFAGSSVTEREMLMQGNGCRRAILTARAYKFLVLATLVWSVIQGSTAIAQQPVRNEPASAQASPNDEIEQLRKSVRQLTAEVARSQIGRAHV